MVMAFSLGLLLGFLMCVPVGPINIWVVKTKLKDGFLPAMLLALGGAIMDFVYFFMILSGLSFWTISPPWETLLKVVGVILLLVLGFRELFPKPYPIDVYTENSSSLKRSNGMASSFFLGVILYVSNPTIIATLSGLCAFIKSFQLFPVRWDIHLALSLGVFLGALLWFYVLLRIVGRLQRKMSLHLLLRFNRGCGAFIILAGFFMTFKIIQGLVGQG